MSEFARHLIGVLSLGVLGLLAAFCVLAFVFWILGSAFSYDADPDDQFLARAFLVVLVLVALVLGAGWGLA